MGMNKFQNNFQSTHLLNQAIIGGNVHGLGSLWLRVVTEQSHESELSDYRLATSSGCPNKHVLVPVVHLERTTIEPSSTK